MATTTSTSMEPNQHSQELPGISSGWGILKHAVQASTMLKQASQKVAENFNSTGVKNENENENDDFLKRFSQVGKRSSERSDSQSVSQTKRSSAGKLFGSGVAEALRIREQQKRELTISLFNKTLFTFPLRALIIDPHGICFISIINEELSMHLGIASARTEENDYLKMQQISKNHS